MPRGPRPTPTKLLMLRGSKRGKARAKRGEVQPPAAVLAAPIWLNEAGQAHWRETAPLLHQLGLLTALDSNAWAMACVAFARARALDDIVEREGMLLPTAREGLKPHPALRASEREWDIYMRLAKEFGATPAARVNLNVHPPEIDQLDAFLASRRGKPPQNDKARFFRKPSDEDRFFKMPPPGKGGA